MRCWLRRAAMVAEDSQLKSLIHLQICGAGAEADATDEVTIAAVEEGRGGRIRCCLRRAAMAVGEEACGALPAAVEEEGSGSHESCFPKKYLSSK